MSSGAYDDSSQDKPSSGRNEKKSKSSKRRGDESENVSAYESNVSDTRRSSDNGRPPKPESLPASRARVDDDEDENRGMHAVASTAQLTKWTEALQRDQLQSRGKERVVRETVSIGKPPTGSGATSNKAPSNVSTAAKKKVEDEDNYDDEGFEDYDEDFEDDSPQKAPPPKKPTPSAAPARGPSPQTTTRSSTPGSARGPAEPEINVDELRHSMQQENQEALRRKMEDGGADAKVPKSDASETKRSKKSAPESRTQAPAPKDQEVAASKTATSAVKPRTKRFSGANMSVSAAMTLDPRGRRLAKLFSSGVLDMQEEKVTQLNITPSNPYDQYQRSLRSQPSSIRQQAAPAEQETRDVEVATDEIVMKDKEMQFSYGDDTRLLNIIKAVNERREARRKGKTPTNTLLEDINKDIGNISLDSKASTETNIKDEAKDNSDSSSNNNGNTQSQATSPRSTADTRDSNVAAGSRLGFFLQRASLLCETLMDEIRHSRSDAHTVSADSRKNRALFIDSAWQTFGQAHFVDEKARLVMNRRTVSVRFSPLQPHLLVTAHPFPDNPDNGDDGHPLKGLYSIWDVFTPGAPVHVLAASGQPTCCCFSSAQTFLLLAGTAEGSLHLWDLRENTLIHKERGVRAPCYSTHFNASSGSGTGSNQGQSQSRGGKDILTDEQHNAPIAQVEALGDSDWGVAAVVSQFASLDRSGTIILWITSNLAAPGVPTGPGSNPSNSSSGGDGLSSGSSFDAAAGGVNASDLGLSPWGRVALVQTKVLRSYGLPTQIANPLSGAVGNSGKLSGKDRDREFGDSHGLASALSTAGGAKASRAVLCSIPGDASTILLAGPKGAVRKVARFGDAAAPQQLTPEVARVEVSVQHDRDRDDIGGKPSGLLEELPLFAPVTCISVRAQPKGLSSGSTGWKKHSREDREEEKDSEESKEADRDSASPSASLGYNQQMLVLVGRADGTVDLYDVDADSPLHTWTISDFTEKSAAASSAANSRSRSRGDTSAIAMVRWCPSRASAFVVVDCSGNCHYFDLLQDPYEPILSDMLDTDKVSPQTVDLSRCRPGSKTAYLAATSATASAGAAGKSREAGSGSVAVRRLWEGVVQAAVDEEDRLGAIMAGWAGRSCLPQVTAFLNSGDNVSANGGANRGK